LRLELYSGAGNRFLLAEEDGSGRDWARLARERCAEAVFDGARPDGLLVVDRGGVLPRMTSYNPDGTLPEACGNGLRCIAWHLLRTGAASPLRIAAVAGERRAELVRADGAVAELFTSMGEALVEPLLEGLPPVPGLLGAHAVHVGNPHAVLRVEDERALELEEPARRLAGHPAFPRGVNVGFLARREGRWHLRVHERGVGETEGCGTGVTAAVATLLAPGDGELEVVMRGGPLRVRREADGSLALAGEARWHGGLGER
jgi:diaminopimelate epimerase